MIKFDFLAQLSLSHLANWHGLDVEFASELGLEERLAAAKNGSRRLGELVTGQGIRAQRFGARDSLPERVWALVGLPRCAWRREDELQRAKRRRVPKACEAAATAACDSGVAKRQGTVRNTCALKTSYLKCLQQKDTRALNKDGKCQLRVNVAGQTQPQRAAARRSNRVQRGGMILSWHPRAFDSLGLNSSQRIERSLQEQALRAYGNHLQTIITALSAQEKLLKYRADETVALFPPVHGSESKNPTCLLIIVHNAYRIPTTMFVC